MADKTIGFSKSIVAQKDISGNNTMYITQLSKPIILKGISTKTCQNVLYTIDGVNFTEETTIGDSNVLSMAIVPFQLGGAEIDLDGDYITRPILNKAFRYILGRSDIDEDISIDDPISEAEGTDPANGVYRYLLQYLADNKDKIEWDTGDLFLSLDPDRQDSFGGSDFITHISVVAGSLGTQELSIDKQSDANGLILKPLIRTEPYSNVIKIKQSSYFFLYPEACPDSGSSQKLIIDNFWRGGGLLASSLGNKRRLLMLYIFAVA